MYIINVKPLSGKTPRRYAVNIEKHPGDLGVTATVLADAPETGLEKVFIMFRRLAREPTSDRL